MSTLPTPSEMMRLKRPNLYSDSQFVDAYKLSESEFGHHLETLTERNQHKDFEIFCRKLCEREISPNLRPATGPEGGGDGKIDSDTYAVSEAVSERWYIGDGASGDEHWAFAFSTKADWLPKIRSDVKAIIETGRGYDRIICMTARAARQRDRLNLEEDLKKTYGVPVTIFDREWIIDRVFSHSHKDLAFTELHAGSHEPRELQIGPEDFRRQQALDVLENRIAKIGSKPQDQTQIVTDSFEAAQLSRELERPRYETEGRFRRAIKLAKKYGSTSQLLRATYEDAWTQFWWFDDADEMQQRYEDVEDIAFPTDLAEHVSKVCNLHQLLVGRVLNGFETAEELSLVERTTRLRSKLSELTEIALRPSNALHAKTLLIFLGLSERMARREADFDDVWIDLAVIIESAAGLGEYPVEMLDMMIAAISDFAPESGAFDALVEKLAEFMSERQKELTAGDLYVQQGERKLKAEKPIDGIKWLGRAAVNYAKDESREKQAEALYLLAIAYQGASLFWAARSTAFAALMQYFALSEREGELRVEAIPTLALIASVSLRIGQVADFLDTIQFLRSLKDVLPLDEASTQHLEEQLREFDELLACSFVSKSDDEIARLSGLPDILENLLLFSSRLVLLYRLGQSQILYKDGSIPADTSAKEVAEIMTAIAAQPATHSLQRNVIIVDDGFTGISTRVLGVHIDILSGSDQNGFLAAETYAAALEAFAATLLNARIYPHIEKLTINLASEVSATLPTIKVPNDRPVVEITIPEAWNLTEVASTPDFNEHLVEAIVTIVARIAVMPDPGPIMEIFGTERVFDRATVLSRTSLYRQRAFGGPVGLIANLRHLQRRSYFPTDDRPPVPSAEQLPFDDESEGNEANAFRDLDRHDELVIRSVIDSNLWDKAKWKGLMFGQSPGMPPILALMFSDAAYGEAIFRQWHERFGKDDSEDTLRITIIRGIDRKHPHHYRAHISHELDTALAGLGKPIMNVARMTTMMPSDSRNLERFLDLYRLMGIYFLTAAIIGNDGAPEFRLDLAITKRKLSVKDAWTIGEHDFDVSGIRSEDDPIIPDGEIDPPIRKVMELRSKFKAS